MKVTVKRVALLEGLAKVRPGIPNKHTLPICCRVLLRAEKGLELVGTDLGSVIIVPVKARVDKPGAFAVFPAKLEGFLKACDTENVLLDFKTTTEHYKQWEELKDENGNPVKDERGLNKRGEVEKTRKLQKLVVEAGNANTTLDSVPDKDFPPYKLVEEKPTCTFQNLAGAIDQVSYAVYKGTDRPILNGICFSTKGKRLEMAAADGFRLAKTTPIVRGKLPDFVLPLEAVNLVRKTFTGKVTVATHVATGIAGTGEAKQVDTLISFKADGVTVLAHGIPGTFPKYEQLIPTKGKLFQCAGDDVRKALKIIGVIKPTNNSFDLTKKGANVIASGHDDDGQRTEVKFPARGQIKVTVDIHYLADIMARTNGTLKLRFNSEKSPLLVQEGRTSHVLMPKVRG
jgi:DNA polymerase III sliding clamp (beta) subunit (PCNA family)